MITNKPVNKVDRVVHEIQNLKDIIRGGCDSFDNRLVSIEKHVDSILAGTIYLKNMLRMGTWILDLVFNGMFLVLWIFVVSILMSIH